MPDKPTDPHPENEEHYQQQRRPGGADPKPHHQDVNDYAHNGKAPEKPRNVESELNKNRQ
jgi:hypothetical protein